MVTIVQKGNPTLHTIAEELDLTTLTDPAVQKILRDLKIGAQQERFGVAIAAPQIGVSVRIFAVRSTILTENPDEEKTINTIFINPCIVKSSKKMEDSHEGCLSVQGFSGTVRRHKNVTIRYYDEDGVLRTRGAGGLLAMIFQHEIDHLDGILYTEKAHEIHAVDEDFNRID